MYQASRIFQLFFWSLFILGCKPDVASSNKNEKAAEISKHTPTSHQIAAAPKTERIVSMAPNITEFLFALGVGSQVVGVTKFCDFPKSVKDLPKIGGLNDTSLESVLALKPTLVIGVESANRAKTEAILKKAKIDSLWLRVESVQDVLNVPEQLAAKLKIPHAKEFKENLEKQLSIVKSNLATRPKVLIIFGMKPIIGAGPKTYVSELVHRAGGQNILKTGPAYPQLDNEKLIELDPDIIFDLSFGKHAKLPKSLKVFNTENLIRPKNLGMVRPSPRISIFYNFIKLAIKRLEANTKNSKAHSNIKIPSHP